MSSPALRLVLAGLAAVALLVPATAVAAPGKAPVAEAAKKSKKKKPKKQKKAKLVTANVTGSVVSATEERLVVRVTQAAGPAKGLRGRSVTFTLGAVEVLDVADVNEDAEQDANDLAAGDRVKVQAKIRSGATGGTFAARKVWSLSNPAPADALDEELDESLDEGLDDSSDYDDD
jgi:hypothetical protein